MSQSLYEKLSDQCEFHVREKLQSLLGQTPDPEAFLNLVLRAWDDHCQQLLNIRNIFLYLDRAYVLQTAGLKSIW